MANLFLTGSGAPTSGIGEATDYYRDTVTNLIYYKDSPTNWVGVPSLIPTPDGVGTTWLYGNGEPSNAIGVTDDYYRNEDNGAIYRKDGLHEWQPVGTLDFIGLYGVQWGNGLGAPANIAPLNNLPAGSFYLDVTTSDIYYKDDSLAWVLKGQLGGGGGSGGSVTVVDSLTSTSTTAALSANQGNVLDSRLQAVENAQAGYGDIVGYNASSFVLSESLTTELSTKADLVEGKVPASQLPSYVDDVEEYANLASFPLLGEASKLYIAIDTNLVYRWTGSTYASTSSALALGETSATAYRGDRGKAAYDHTQATGNPHSTAIGDISGLQGAIDDAAVNFAAPTVNSQSGVSYIVGTVSTDNDGKTYLRMTSGSANTVTIPSTQTKPISISQRGAGTTTLVAGSGVTLNGTLAFTAQHQTKTAIPLGSGIYDVVG